MNHAIGTRIHIVTPYQDHGMTRYTPTMRELFSRLGFDHNGYPSAKVWAEGWQMEHDVLTRAERRALGFRP